MPVRSATVLVVDDEESFHDFIARHLKRFRVLTAQNGWQALRALEEHHVDVVLLDLRLPGIGGFEVLERIKAQHDDVEVIIITAHSELPNALEAGKKGAFDFVAKSYESYKQIGEYVDRALLHRRHRREQLERESRHWWFAPAFAAMRQSRSAAFRGVLDIVEEVAPTPLSVLLEGESGVGKEVMARFLHAVSDRSKGPFVTADLSAVPHTLLDAHLFGHVKGAFTGADKTQIGKFEMADGGTLFLDEIGGLEAAAQAKLVRVLQEREIERLGAPEPCPVDVRLVAATNRDLRAEVSAGRFREDLFYRLDVVRVCIPPLRERRADIPALVELLMDKQARLLRRELPEITTDALRVLGDHDWPGNVRELENLVMRLVALQPGKRITTDDIPTEYCLHSLHKLAYRLARTESCTDGGQGLYFLAREKFGCYLVRHMVNRFGGDRHAAASALGVSLSTIKQKLRASSEGGSHGDPDDGEGDT